MENNKGKIKDIAFEDVPAYVKVIRYAEITKKIINDEVLLKIPEPKHFPCIFVTYALFEGNEPFVFAGENKKDLRLVCGIEVNGKKTDLNDFVNNLSAVIEILSSNKQREKAGG